MQKIVEIKFGSHLYGTSTAESDLDIKGVYIPSARDILLQRIQPVIISTRPKMHGEKNTMHDIDYEVYSLTKFLDLLSQGQTVALDMLFAPESAMLSPPKEEWLRIKELAPSLLTKQAASFLRYCKQQANKYGIKGSRVAAARAALEFLKKAEMRHGAGAKLAVTAEALEALTQGHAFLMITKDYGPNNKPVYFFEICGKKVLFDVNIKSALSVAQRLVDEYGQRALAAEHHQGIDWKALSHAVRVGHEAIEFLTTYHITFPRPEAKHLLKIKQGALPFQQVSEEIEQLLIDVEAAAASSSLPDMCNPSVIDDYVESVYRAQILKGDIDG